ncbi:MAG: 50S ribosomal protein L17 [Firmicutes bacterium]|uniref:Large ribosomal subunit protein bL17 n=1 Tax=Sulfobacillus benefaciens TaxID=453960 RepID=A0A2T2X7U5_9FIRM|nr:50S ribosomal protein L17 [Bacillota bacterium]MCL5014084.1 50S ribosomal protein L17 [Bacillota bacterium]PSR30559.1 MAG: 50S ribosomal protein L17 [Sulfobacillus benefaciens]HBQ94756.1 50S ribosomal protein L17 [Sulfobacillus sp.]
MPGMHRKLGRIGGHRRAMLRNLVTSTLREERIETTVTRAKEVNRVVEHMITLAKKGDLAARRQALAYVWDEDVVTKLFTAIGPRYQDRTGGYTRIMRTGFRRGDAAPMAILELV